MCVIGLQGVIIDERHISRFLDVIARPYTTKVEEVLDKGLKKKGLSLEDVTALINVDEPEPIQKIYSTAAQIKQEIYGERLVLFAPLYISDYCINDCAYCNFHLQNTSHPRRKLGLDEIATETKCLIDMGHKRVLVEFGEDPEKNNIDYVCEAIRAIYSVRSGNGNIRRVNVNIAATSVEDYRKLKAESIGTYQLFQETYHRETYKAIHIGPKADYDRQITAHNRAREAGLDDLGIGVLFGLYDWRFEVLALVAHAQYMERELGVGPHTISVPRFRPAPSVMLQPRYAVSDEDFLKLIAILRIAVPYAGMILSTREPPELRRRAFQLGISQASAASVCSPGGYTDEGRRKMEEGRWKKGQFAIQDNRPVDEVIKSVIADGLIPSFCTACYRIGRTGETFMEIAKPGDIHNFCRPNALLTFAEYLEDYGDKESIKKGSRLIEKYLLEINDRKIRNQTIKRIAEIKSGKRDLYF